MRKIAVWIILFFFYEVLWSYIQLKGPDYSIKNATILLNCSSDSPPYGLYAEFLVNGRSHTNVRRSNEKCLTGETNLDCRYHNCSCSTIGLWYAFQYAIPTNIGTLKSRCVMRFKTSGQQFSDKSTIILDIKGPTIEAPNGIPIAAGIQTDLICIACATNVDIKLVWNCQELRVLQHSNLITNSTEYISTLTFMPSSVHNGINCSCVLRAGKYFRSTSIQLVVTNSPVLRLIKRTECLSTLSIVLTCTVSGELFKYGFKRWIHSVNGVIIRKLTGLIAENTSSIIIKSCGYQDAGSYTCEAWNEYRMETILINKTSLVKVLGPPVVVQSHTTQDLNTLLTVKFYSIVEPINVQWYLFHKQITNTSAIVLPTEIEIMIYGKKIVSDGYYTNITLENLQGGTYSVIIENKYGKTKEIIEVYNKGYTYKLSVLLWILTGVAVFISTVTLTTLFLRRRNSGIFFTETKPVIYHAAPQLEPQVLPYNDIHDNPYDDCNEDPTGTPYYIDVIDSEEEITVPESSCQSVVAFYVIFIKIYERSACNLSDPSFHLVTNGVVDKPEGNDCWHSIRRLKGVSTEEADHLRTWCVCHRAVHGDDRTLTEFLPDRKSTGRADQ
ncbi:Hypothetical predicted protein [Mytilus galloprovincialis]|uniref:Ig-like domain-containing protein n=1 Tax=Mytilus galloprovincialis TaxID=29158 RepID=A0A8B6CKA2_MYTGA|nr:Hypothetical predicted protein [Mytilus galloprovincialis]